MTVKEQQAVRLSIQRSRPLGRPTWQRGTAERLGWTHTLPAEGRPRKATRSKEKAEN